MRNTNRYYNGYSQLVDPDRSVQFVAIRPLLNVHFEECFVLAVAVDVDYDAGNAMLVIVAGDRYIDRTTDTLMMVVIAAVAIATLIAPATRHYDGDDMVLLVMMMSMIAMMWAMKWKTIMIGLDGFERTQIDVNDKIVVTVTDDYYY